MSPLYLSIWHNQQSPYCLVQNPILVCLGLVLVLALKFHVPGNSSVLVKLGWLIILPRSHPKFLSIPHVPPPTNWISLRIHPLSTSNATWSKYPTCATWTIPIASSHGLPASLVGPVHFSHNSQKNFSKRKYDCSTPHPYQFKASNYT